MGTRRRVRWGPRPGHEKLQASLAEGENWWIPLVLGFVGMMVFFGVLSSNSCIPYDAGNGRIGPPTSEVSPRQWYGDPGR